MADALTPAYGAAADIRSPGGLVDYDGESGELFGLGFKVTLLTIVTLGIYTFWGKTRIRQYLWGHLMIRGDRLEYTGTGKELFFGFLLAMAVLIPISILVGLLQFALAGYGPLAEALVNLAFYIFFLLLLGVATYRARRYRLTRSVWRGIRFGQTGSAFRYSLRFMGWLIVTVLTLGIALPVMQIRLSSFEMNRTWFGDRQFAFHGRARDLMKTWLICLILIPFTLGISYLWYIVYQTRYVISSTEFEGFDFELPITFGEVVSAFRNLLLVGFGIIALLAIIALVSIHAFSIAAVVAFIAFFLFSQAIFLAFVTHLLLVMLADRLIVHGDGDFDALINNVQQNPDTLPATGEGLATALGG